MWDGAIVAYAGLSLMLIAIVIGLPLLTLIISSALMIALLIMTRHI